MSGAAGFPVRKGYESIPRDLLQPGDGVMTARALGVLAHLLSRPDGWRSSAEKLAKTFKEGRAAMETALRELESLGYLIRQRVKSPDGRWDWVWLYGDDPAYLAEKLEATLADLRAQGHIAAGHTVPQESGYGNVVDIAAGQTVPRKTVSR